MDYSNFIKDAKEFRSQVIEDKCKGKEFWCKVECQINGHKYQTMFGTISPENAIEFAKQNFNLLSWIIF